MTTHPAKHNLYVYRGATFSEAITWKDENGIPVDLTGFTARMHMRMPVGIATAAQIIRGTVLINGYYE